MVDIKVIYWSRFPPWGGVRRRCVVVGRGLFALLHAETPPYTLPLEGNRTSPMLYIYSLPSLLRGGIANNARWLSQILKKQLNNL